MKPGDVITDFEELPEAEGGSLRPGDVVSDFEEIPEQEDSLSGGLEAAARGAAEGASLGFSEELGSALAAPLVKRPGEKTLEAYRRLKTEQEKKREALEEQYPITSTASEIAGGILLPIPGTSELAAAKGAAKVGRAALLGSGIGAVQAVGKSKSSSPKELAEESIKGGALGLGLGGLGELALQAGSRLIPSVSKGLSELETPQNMKAQYEAGLKGIRTFGKSAEEEASKMRTDIAESAFDKFSNLSRDNVKRTLAAKEYSAALDAAEKGGVEGLDVLSGLNRAKQEIESSIDPTNLDEVNSQLNKALQKVESLQSRIENSADPRMAATIKKEMDAFEDQLTNDYAASVFGRAKSNVVEEANKIPGIPEANKTYSSIFKIQDLLGLTGRSGAEKADYSSKILQWIRQASGGSGETKDAAISNIRKFNEHLSNLPPEVKDPIEKGLAEAIEKTKLVKEASDFGLGLTSLKTYAGLAERGANVAGQTIKSAKDFTPQAVKGVVSKLAQAGGASSELAQQLVKLTRLDTRGRQALMFAIMQNPEYRKLLQENGISEKK